MADCANRFPIHGMIHVILIHAAFDSSGLALVALFPSTPPYYLPVHYQTLGIAIVFSIAAVVFIVVTKGDLSYHRVVG